MGGVEEILLRVIIGRSGDDNEFRIAVGALPVKSCNKVQWLLFQVLLYVLILNRTLLPVDFIYLLPYDIDSDNLVVLRQ